MDNKIYVVGIGPGAYEQMTMRAAEALRRCDVIVGYTVYVELVKEHFANKRFLTTPMKKEIERCRLAFEEANKGYTAVLGAPLIHDFAVISLSDLLTPWEKIEKRLLCASEADFVICLYNPSSKKRHDYLQKACDLMMRSKDPDTVCGTVSNIGREGEMFRVMTLKELRDTRVDMFTTVYIGNSQTKMLNGKMVTPRGYIHG